MRNKIVAGLTACVAAAAVAAPAQAQVAPTAPTGTPAPAVSASKCTVRHSMETKAGFTYADCELSVTNVPGNETVKIHYSSNLKTYTPKGAEFGPWNHRSGTITAYDGEVTTLQMGFPGKTAAQVRKQLKVALSTTTPGVTVTTPFAHA